MSSNVIARCFHVPSTLVARYLKESGRPILAISVRRSPRLENFRISHYVNNSKSCNVGIRSQDFELMRKQVEAWNITRLPVGDFEDV